MLQETPWHHRQANFEHYRRFKLLHHLHEITTCWINEVQANRPAHFLDRGFSPEISDSLWMLDVLSTSDLDHLLDDTKPSDVLGRLEKTVWAVQATTFARLFEKTPEKDRPALKSAMEQIAWKLGRRYAEANWAKLVGDEETELRSDLRRLLLTLADTPACPSPKDLGYIIKRATSQEVEFELLSCPHQSPFLEVQPVADRLCGIHMQWIQGFVYGLNVKVKVTAGRAPGAVRCHQRWSL